MIYTPCGKIDFVSRLRGVLSERRPRRHCTVMRIPSSHAARQPILNRLPFKRLVPGTFRREVNVHNPLVNRFKSYNTTEWKLYYYVGLNDTNQAMV